MEITVQYRAKAWILLIWLSLGPVANQVTSSTNSGIRCLECHGAATPSDCTTWVTCGTGEECFTREFHTQSGTFYHTGCEQKSRCDLYRRIDQLLGKRRSTHGCFACCDSDDCNAGLCGGAGPQTYGRRLRCKSCHSVSDPRVCYKWTLCLEGEVCSTSTDRDFRGDLQFKLGCEYKTFCLPGVPAPTTPPDPRNCRQCCNTPVCNSQLCLTSLGRFPTAPTPTFRSGCPPPFLKQGSFCFHVYNGTGNWHAAETDCEVISGKLVAIETKAKDDVIQQLLTKSADNTVKGYWLGGYYSEAARSWMWPDLNLVTFSRWAPGQPTSATDGDRMVALTPTGNETSWEWTKSSHKTSYNYICEPSA